MCILSLLQDPCPHLLSFYSDFSVFSHFNTDALFFHIQLKVDLFMLNAYVVGSANADYILIFPDYVFFYEHGVFSLCKGID